MKHLDRWHSKRKESMKGVGLPHPSNIIVPKSEKMQCFVYFNLSNNNSIFLAYFNSFLWYVFRILHVLKLKKEHTI